MGTANETLPSLSLLLRLYFAISISPHNIQSLLIQLSQFNTGETSINLVLQPAQLSSPDFRVDNCFCLAGLSVDVI